MKSFIALSSALLMTISSFSQSDWMWNQMLYFGDTNYSQAGISGSAEYELVSNNLSNQLVNEAIFKGKINPSSTQSISSLNHAEFTRFSAGMNANLWFRTKDKGSWRWLFGGGMTDRAFVVIKTGLAQLYLNGNGPYEDQTLDLGPSEILYHSYQFVGTGIEHNNKTTRWGATIQLIKSSRYADAKIGTSTLYTAPYGTSVVADVRFQYDITSTSQPKAAAWYGTGYGLNAYFIHQASPDAPFISFQVQDLGQIFYQGVNRKRMSDSLVFNGIEANNVLQLDDSLISNGSIDSLDGLLGIQSSHPHSTVWLPTNINVSYIHPLTSKLRLALGLKQYIGIGLPELRAGLAYQPASWISLEPHIRFGGFTRFDVGLNIGLRAGKNFQLIIKSEQFENLISPSKTSGQYAFVGGQLKF